MSCSRGKASPDTYTKLRLFADSGGYCQNPSCLNELFQSIDGKDIHFAEMAHIFAASDTGPRSKDSLSENERGDYNNLILLCANCHTIIDKAEEQFKDELISRWKLEHKNKIAEVFGFRKLSNRKEARLAILPLLRENKKVFDNYGPLGEERFNPESDLPSQWLRKIRNIIIPNNRKILSIADSNRELLSENEIDTLESFRQHVEDFEAKHIGDVKSNGIQFPLGMSNLFEDKYNE